MKKLLLTIFIFSSISLTAQINVSTSVQNNSTNVGIENSYTVEITSESPDFKVKDPESTFYTGESETVPLYMITGTDVKDYNEKGVFIRTINYKIVYFITGTYDLPRPVVHDSEDNPVNFTAPRIEVAPVSKEESFADIEPPFARSGNYKRIILLILALLALAVIIYFIVRIVKKRISRPKAIPVIVPVEKFMDSYNRLQQKQLLENDQIEDYCTELSIIFRRFLDDRFKMGALDLTTDEIFRACSSVNINSTNANRLKHLMYLWDLAKFAEMRPSREIVEGNANETLDLVKDLDRGGQ
ncbi:MAG: hypothetical protein JXK07_15465 [Spirochaetes bacterium]|nr:hypothetical protein [Spirochaetota bacterium]MBN2769514.1 hypothetical protein [Spirochaetota bacterium]